MTTVGHALPPLSPSREEFHRIKRLADEVVCSRGEGFGQVLGGVPSRDHNEIDVVRGIPGADCSAEFEPGHFGQHPVDECE